MSLELTKSLLTTLAVLVAIVQLWSMGQVRGYVRLVAVDKRTLITLHRWGGITGLALVALVGTVCLYAVLGAGYGLYSPRVQAHAVLGTLAGIVLLTKVLIANRFRRHLRHALALGLAAAGLLGGVFIFSAVWYFSGAR